MAKIVQLNNHGNKDEYFPLTSAKAVVMDGGGTADEILKTAVLKTPQTFTDDEKSQIKQNIGIEVVQTVGDSETSFMSQKAVKTALESKQDVLKSGINIKTINGQSLIGPGNIVITGGGSSTMDEAPNDGGTYARQNDNWVEITESTVGFGDSIEDIKSIDETLLTTALRKTPQTLTEDEKAQVRKNLGIPDIPDNLVTFGDPQTTGGNVVLSAALLLNIIKSMTDDEKTQLLDLLGLSKAVGYGDQVTN